MTDLIDTMEDTLKGRFLTFSLGKETYGIEIRYVTEIVGIQPVTEMPEMPSYLKGIINLRNKIIPVMDVRLRFAKQPRDYDDRTCVIVVDIHGLALGLIVDSVSEVLSIAEEDIDDCPDSTPDKARVYQKHRKGGRQRNSSDRLRKAALSERYGAARHRRRIIVIMRGGLIYEMVQNFENSGKTKGAFWSWR